MKKSEVVFLTTIFPASLKFLDAFFSSLQKQTYANFDLLVVNDGIANFEGIKLKYQGLNIIEVISNFSASKNREVGINKALELDYKFIIFGDSDDYFSENRIKESLFALEKSDIVVNELTIVNREKLDENFFSTNIGVENIPPKDFCRYNIFGFSNVAIRAQLLDNPVTFDDELIAVDWYFFTTLLLKKEIKSKFLTNVYTFYRQHNENTIGISTQLTESKLLLSVKVKQLHYAAILKYCKDNKLNDYYSIFEKINEQVYQLSKKLESSSFNSRYLKTVNNNKKKIFNGWWSEVMSLEEFYKYESKN